MAKIFRIGYFFLILILFWGSCRQPVKRDGIITTIYPNYLILRSLVPQNIPLDYIVKPGMDPHHFSMNMDMAKKLSQSKLIILNGFGLDNFLSRKYKDHNIFYMSEFAEPLYSNMLKGNNPHLWLSPNEILKILPYLIKVLETSFPEDKSTIEENSRIFKKQLEDMIKKIELDLNPYKNITIATYHPAWGYFARDMGLKEMIFVKRTPHEELSAKEMVIIIKKLVEENVHILLSEASIQDNIIKNLQKDVKELKVVIVDPIGFAINAGSYEELILKNERSIINGLK
ncbi:zinc ABC transporter substrate-binding protein [bacterium]|nr:zinc ABC transporter substrate-binding protein [bacterium]